ncbi:hypothetical protein BDB01DRAFT_833851 [Pilobolus umbonatus]|nr:hypothetical protein BDB01DRAFT_833851 [Pilobolus umbonatus]
MSITESMSSQFQPLLSIDSRHGESNYSSITHQPVHYEPNLGVNNNTSFPSPSLSTSSLSPNNEHKEISITDHITTQIRATYNTLSTTVYLKNKGSVARDHLANERTYLAWLRTSLATISVGIGFIQLCRLERLIHNQPYKTMNILEGETIGLLFVLVGILLLLFGCIRYFHIQVTMTNDYFPASRSIVGSAAIVLLLLMILMLFSVTIPH